MSLCYLWHAIPVELRIIVFPYTIWWHSCLYTVYELGSSANKLLYVLFCQSLPGDWLGSSAHTHVSVQSNWSMEPPTNLHMVDSPIQQQYVRTCLYSFCLILKNTHKFSITFFLINIQFEYFVLNAESNPQNCTTNRPQRHKWLLLLFCGLAIFLRFTSFTFERREKYSIQFIFHLSNFNAMWSLL